MDKLDTETATRLLDTASAILCRLHVVPATCPVSAPWEHVPQRLADGLCGTRLPNNLMVSSISATTTPSPQQITHTYYSNMELTSLAISTFHNIHVLCVPSTLPTLTELLPAPMPMVGEIVFASVFTADLPEPQLLSGVVYAEKRGMHGGMPSGDGLLIDVALGSSALGAPVIDASSRLVGVVAGEDVKTGRAFVVCAAELQRIIQRALNGKKCEKACMPFSWRRIGRAEITGDVGSVQGDLEGVTITHVIPGGGAGNTLQEGDIVRTMNGRKVGPDGTIDCGNGGHVILDAVIGSLHSGERIEIEVLRGGRVGVAWFNLFGVQEVVPSQRFVLLGGMVCMDGRYGLLLEEVLDLEMNYGYAHLRGKIVESVNGKMVQSVENLLRVLEELLPRTLHMIIGGELVILESDTVEESTKELCSLYHVTRIFRDSVGEQRERVLELACRGVEDQRDGTVEESSRNEGVAEEEAVEGKCTEGEGTKEVQGDGNDVEVERETRPAQTTGDKVSAVSGGPSITPQDAEYWRARKGRRRRHDCDSDDEDEPKKARKILSWTPSP